MTKFVAVIVVVLGLGAVASAERFPADTLTAIRRVLAKSGVNKPVSDCFLRKVQNQMSLEEFADEVRSKCATCPLPPRLQRISLECVLANVPR
jgi:hypothetical protein